MSNLEKGIEIENFVAERFKNETPWEMELNHTWGTDIVLNTPIGDIKVEVKSANRFVNNGKHKPRSGKFSFIPNNLKRPDYFAFVICKENNKRATYWVKGFEIREHFNNRKTMSEKSKFTLGIPTLLNNIKKVDFSEVIQL